LREYHRPTDLPAALSLLQSADHQLLNLGPRPPLAPFANAEAVVDLAALNLNAITETAVSISIGAQTTLQAIAESPALHHFANDLLPQAVQYVAHLGLRNVATLSATLASPDSSPELHLALLALRAQADVLRTERRTVTLMAYEPDPDELLLGISFERPLNPKAAIARVARSPLDAAIVAAVAVVTPTTTTVAVAGASPRPIVIQSANPPRPDTIAEAVIATTNPIADYRGSAGYRKAMAGVLAERALNEASKP
jgi:CO/xanthine dehydrogenase FAD-binding subunit